MGQWPSVKAARLLAALLSIGWKEKRRKGSHRILCRNDWPDFLFAFHDGVEVGPALLSRIAKDTGLTPDDL